MGRILSPNAGAALSMRAVFVEVRRLMSER